MLLPERDALELQGLRNRTRPDIDYQAEYGLLETFKVQNTKCLRTAVIAGLTDFDAFAVSHKMRTSGGQFGSSDLREAFLRPALDKDSTIDLYCERVRLVSFATFESNAI